MKVRLAQQDVPSFVLDLASISVLGESSLDQEEEVYVLQYRFNIFWTKWSSDF